MSSWAVALRLGRRGAWRTKGRSALVIAMIGLPVLGVTAVDVTWTTEALSPDQAATRTMGAADAVLSDPGEGAIVQDGQGNSYGTPNGAAPSGVATTPLQSLQALRRGAALLPQGSRSLPDISTPGELSAGSRSVPTDLRQLSYDDPLAAGLYRQVSGRAPSGPDEVVLTQELSRRLQALPGSVVRLSTPTVALHVVGIVADGSRSDARTALLDPGAVAGLGGPPELLIAVPGALHWADVQRANAAGVLIRGRHRVVDAPPDPQFGSGIPVQTFTTIVLVVGLALLEVVLLAGPAFAVGTKRQARELALLAAAGGERRDVRRAVLAGAIVLGAVGGALGAALGTVGAKVLVPLLAARTHDVPGPFEVPYLQLLGIVAVGVVTALLAAVFPARQAARQDVVAALTGRRGTVLGRRWVPAAGVAAAAVGAAIAWSGAQRRDTVILLLGSAVAELGLVATTPALVGLAGRLGPFLPATARLALRDASRNRSRTAPAVSAVLAAVAGAVAVGTFLASQDGYDRQLYHPRALPGTVVVPVGTDDPSRDALAMAAILRRQLPNASVVNLRSVGEPAAAFVEVRQVVAKRCLLNRLQAAPTVEQVRAAAKDPHCQGDSGTALASSTVVGGPDELAALTGVRNPATTAALEAGGAVGPDLYVTGAGTLTAVRHEQSGKPAPDRAVTLRAAALPAGSLGYIVLSPAAARRLAPPGPVLGVVAATGGPVSSDQEDRLRAALDKVHPSLSPYVERGYSSSAGLGLLALVAVSALLVVGASSIATGLAAAEGRADLATLAAIGASPRLRRGLAGLQSAVTAGLGSLLGLATGLVPALGVVRALNSNVGQPGGRRDLYPTVVPWGHLALVVVAAPLAAVLAAWALTRSRLPMVRRLG